MADNGAVRPPLVNRSLMARAPRVVVKIGSSSLTRPDGTLDDAQLSDLTEVLGTRAARGGQVVLVSSGSIAAGVAPLGLPGRPKDLALAQAAASVGQGILIARYASEFAKHGITVGQVLLTVEDLNRRTHYVNARRAMHRLLNHGVLPIVNENDTVATTEIRFGDNDRVAALIAHLIAADALVLLTDVDGLHDGPPSREGTRLIPEVTSFDDIAGIEVTSKGSSVGTGGMVTKLDAAQAAAASGIPVILTSADKIGPALAGEEVGTWFAPTGNRRASRMLWLAHASAVRGTLTLDAGAVHAVVDDNRSLLPAGITAVAGDFEAGDVIALHDRRGLTVARGTTAFDAREVRAMAGRRTREIAEELGYEVGPVVHRDNLALVRTASGR